MKRSKVRERRNMQNEKQQSSHTPRLCTNQIVDIARLFPSIKRRFFFQILDTMSSAALLALCGKKQRQRTDLFHYH